MKAKTAATSAAQAAAAILDGATGDKVRANLDVDVAEEAEREAGEAFHRAEEKGFPKD